MKLASSKFKRLPLKALSSHIAEGTRSALSQLEKATLNRPLIMTELLWFKLSQIGSMQKAKRSGYRKRRGRRVTPNF